MRLCEDGSVPDNCSEEFELEYNSCAGGLKWDTEPVRSFYLGVLGDPPDSSASPPFYDWIIDENSTTSADYRIMFLAYCGDCGDTKISLLSVHDTSYIAAGNGVDTVVLYFPNRP